MPRSGHSCDVFEGQYLILFGGIYEITRELNDLQMFDLTKKKWVSLFDESNSPTRAGRDGSPTAHDPYADNGFQSSLGGGSLGGASPTIFGRKSMINNSSLKAPNLRGANAVGAGVVHHHHTVAKGMSPMKTAPREGRNTTML